MQRWKTKCLGWQTFFFWKQKQTRRDSIFDFSRILRASLYPAKWRAKCSRRWHYVSDACNSPGCARLCGKPIAAEYLWKRHMYTHNRGIESNVWSLKRDFESGLCTQAFMSLSLFFFLSVLLIHRIHFRYLASYILLTSIGRSNNWLQR